MTVNSPIALLLVDDEEEFRRVTRTTLERRGFAVSEASSGEEGLEAVRRNPPDVVILDLKMPGMSGIEALRAMRQVTPTLPVIVLTGHGGFDDALAGIRLDVVDFLQKPVDIDQLATHIRDLLRRGAVAEPLRERTIGELMTLPSLYPRLYADQRAEEAFRTLVDLCFHAQPADVAGHGLRSALVFDRQERFVGMARFNDLLKLAVPPFLADSPYATFFTGMFIAQCKTMGKLQFADILGPNITVQLHAPLMEAVNLMCTHRLVSLPVMHGKDLVGVLRDRAVVLEIARNMARMSGPRR